MFRLVVALSVLCLASATLNEDSEENKERIVGGRIATIFEHPYQVSLQIYSRHFCGASILSSRWCLTAAHCLKDPINNDGINNLSIRIGSSSWKTGGSVKNIDAAINHPNYNPLTYEYDVGLVRTVQAIVFSAAAKPVILITTPYPSGIPVVVSGWGRMDENAKDLPTNLQMVQLTSMSREDCGGPQSIYEPSRITDSMTCAVGYDKDSCQGDSGGPICSNGNTRCQMGVVSWGVGCAKPNAPGVYAALSNAVIIQFILGYVPDASVSTKCPTSMTSRS